MGISIDGRELRHKRPSNVAPPLAAISSSASRGVGLLAQVPHCFRKNGTPLAMHRSRKARIQAGSHSATSKPLWPPPMTQPIPSSLRPGRAVSRGSQDRNRSAASMRSSALSSGKLWACPMVEPSQTFSGRERLKGRQSARDVAGPLCEDLEDEMLVLLNHVQRRVQPFQRDALMPEIAH